MDKRHKRAVGVFIALCTMFSFALLSNPALAAPGPSNQFHPEDSTGGDGNNAGGPAAALGVAHAPGDPTPSVSDELIVSDVSTVLGPVGYPLRGVGTPSAQSASWWDCKNSLPAATMPAAPDCSLIASDTTPTSTVPPTGFLGQNVFDGSYAVIPTAAQFTGGADANAPRDFVMMLCDAAGQEATPTAANCTGDREPDGLVGVGLGAGGATSVHLDAAASTSDHTAPPLGSTGPTDGGDIISPPNGSRVPNGVGAGATGFALTAYTSSDNDGDGVIDIDSLLACGSDLNAVPPVSGTTPDNDTEHTAPCTDIGVLDTTPNDGAGCPGTEPAGMACWSFDGGATPLLFAPNNTQFVLFIEENDDALVDAEDPSSGNGDCDDESGGLDSAADGDDCVLDAILLTSGEVTAAQAHAHNDETNDGIGVPDVVDSGPTFVQSANRKKTGNVIVGDGSGSAATGGWDPLIGSVFSTFADPDGDGNKSTSQSISGEATWSLAGTGGATPTFMTAAGVSACGGAGGGFGFTGLHDHDADGLFEHCHFGAANTGGAPFMYTADWWSGTAGTVEATFCTDAQQDLPADAAHGCADATGSLTDKVTKQVGANHSHVCEDIAGADPHNCPTTIQAQAGDEIDLRAFFRGAGEQGLPNRDVTWLVNPANDPDDPAQLLQRDEFTDANGEAHALVSSPNNAGGKTSTIRVDSDLDGNGIGDGTTPSQIQINWQGPTTGQCIKGTNGNDTLPGTEDDDCIKGRQGNDTVRGKGGNDDLRGQGDDDKLVGGPGNDQLTGGPGFDICRGGAGNDSFAGCEVKKG